ncbi:MAG: hypothetical protein ACPHN0_06645, partial [Candidatus Poseidoniaceae archaeon]
PACVRSRDEGAAPVQILLVRAVWDEVQSPEQTGADLSIASWNYIFWDNTTCPDGTNSDDNGNTCENNL